MSLAARLSTASGSRAPSTFQSPALIAASAVCERDSRVCDRSRIVRLTSYRIPGEIAFCSSISMLRSMSLSRLSILSHQIPAFFTTAITCLCVVLGLSLNSKMDDADRLPMAVLRRNRTNARLSL